MLAPPSDPSKIAAPIAPRLDSPVRGIILAILATACLALSDVVGKTLVRTLPPIEIAWLRYTAMVTLVLLGAAWKGPVRVLKTQRLGWQILRGLGLFGSSMLFLVGLKYLPIADATATGFVWPIFVMALSVPLLGEKVGIRRWSAAIIGLLGVVIVVRPGTSGFQLAALIPILSSLVWSFAFIITRRMSGFENPVTTLTYSGLVGLVVLTVLLPFVWREPSLEEVLLGMLMGTLSVIGHFMVILACRFCDASVIGPLFYVQMIWATLFGIVFLNSVPDRWTIAGSLIILASGIYMANRERIRAKARLLAELEARP